MYEITENTPQLAEQLLHTELEKQIDDALLTSKVEKEIDQGIDEICEEVFGEMSEEVPEEVPGKVSEYARNQMLYYDVICLPEEDEEDEEDETSDLSLRFSMMTLEDLHDKEALSHFYQDELSQMLQEHFPGMTDFHIQITPITKQDYIAAKVKEIKDQIILNQYGI